MTWLSRAGGFEDGEVAGAGKDVFAGLREDLFPDDGGASNGFEGFLSVGEVDGGGDAAEAFRGTDFGKLAESAVSGVVVCAGEAFGEVGGGGAMAGEREVTEPAADGIGEG